jgi:glycosyltransferase involved in cell wall biosynthesis
MSLLSSKSAATLEDLLILNGEAFLHCAYRTILNRAPDDSGIKYYMNRINSGVSKIEVLAQLRTGAEGRSREVSITGLNEAIRRHKQLKNPLLGPLLRMAGLKQVKISGKSSRTLTPPFIDLDGLLEAYGLESTDVPSNLDLDSIRKKNPHESFKSIEEMMQRIVEHTPAQKISVFNEDIKNARLYIKLGVHQESIGNISGSIELYKLSVLFKSTAQAHEYLGNFCLREKRYYLAIAHYELALELDENSSWLHLNLAEAQAQCGAYEKCVSALQRGLKKFPNSEKFLKKFDDVINDYWIREEQKIELLAITQQRDELISEYRKVTTFISQGYSRLFQSLSSKAINVSLNHKRVLIVGLTPEILPQCFRYRIEQKIEQLQFAGYQAESVVWDDYESALARINFYDLIIFYRVPAFPKVLKLMAYARALGKITFYELDDLVCESISLPDIESYGGLISASTYVNLTKDIGYHRSAANNCDYAIGSTNPLVALISPLTIKKKGFLHRNGLDKHNIYDQPEKSDKEHINLFYGSGTLAHNSDFLVEALPAISQILGEYESVQLILVGNLELPIKFLNDFQSRIIRIPFIRNIEAYWTYLAASDINLAVLHDDILAGCKSEIKWLEAATLGIPSVVSRTKNYLDVINNGVDGYVVSGQSEWHDALKKLVEDRNLRKTIGKSALSRALLEYSISTLSNNIGEVFQAAISDQNQTSLRSIQESF